MQHPKLSNLASDLRLAAARVAAQRAMPYLQVGLHTLVPIPTPGLGTCGVTEDARLLYDAEFLGECTAAEAGSVLIHEWCHVYLQHAARWRRLLGTGALTAEDRDEWGQAVDAEINDGLMEAKLPLPTIKGQSPVTPEGLGLPPNRTAEEYAIVLVNRKRQASNHPRPSGGAGGWGDCGSGAGAAIDAEQDLPAGDGRTAAEQARASRACSAAVASAVRSAGRVPSMLAREAGRQLAPSRIPWTTKLAHATRAAVLSVPGLGDYTWTVRNRMQGAFSGDLVPILPGDHRPVARVAFVVDTSGSMQDVELDAALTEATAVLRTMPGCSVTFCAADAEVHDLVEARTVNEMKRHLHGCGGTDFRPAFDALLGRPAHKRPDVVVYCTDGFGRAPAEAPRGVRVIWLLVAGGRRPTFWGDVVEIERSAA